MYIPPLKLSLTHYVLYVMNNPIYFATVSYLS